MAGDAAMNQAAVAELVRFNHPEKVFGYLPGFDETSLAALYGLDAATYRAIRGDFADRARRSAEALLADPAFAERVDALPFPAEATVMGIGDSFTDDLQSWLEILRHLLALRRPEDRIRIVNDAVSARTSSDILHYVMGAVMKRPDWIFCLVGGNDAKRIGVEPTKTLVAPEETAANLDATHRIAVAQTDASWVWITPATVDDARVAAHPGFQMGKSTWRNDDLLAVGDIIRGRSEPVVDLQALFGVPPVADYLGPDGLHPSLAGQQAIARTVVERLTA
jgi:acyl-CoA thioesterase I